MSRPRCFACGSDWNRLLDCRLVYEPAPEEWVSVTICDVCWRGAERREQSLAAERERLLLAEWMPASGGEGTAR